jgi:hypothetical protein
MAIAKPRTRLVYFRISDEEFREMSEVCEKVGARSISDLARLAVRDFMAAHERHPETGLDPKTELAKLLDELKSSVQQITAVANSPKPDETKTTTGKQVAGESS